MGTPHTIVNPKTGRKVLKKGRKGKELRAKHSDAALAKILHTQLVFVVHPFRFSATAWHRDCETSAVNTCVIVVCYPASATAA